MLDPLDPRLRGDDDCGGTLDSRLRGSDEAAFELSLGSVWRCGVLEERD